MKIGKWSTTAGNNSSLPPDGWPEGQAPSTVNDCAREMMAAIKTAFVDLQFFDPDYTPTYINATSFSVAGDQTAVLHAGRRLKMMDVTTLYSTIVSATFAANTTITVTNDSGNLTASLTSFAIAILSNTNPSYPKNVNIDALSVSGATVLGSTLSVSGATHLKSTLSVGNAVNIAGNTFIGSTLTVSGAMALNSTLTVSAASSLIGPVTLGGTLSVSGAAVVAGALTANGAFSVGGATTLAGTLSVSGTVAAANVAKGWGVIIGGNPPTIQAGFNITSISRSATGTYRLNFGSPLTGAGGYALVAHSDSYLYHLDALDYSTTYAKVASVFISGAARVDTAVIHRFVIYSK